MAQFDGHDGAVPSDISPKLQIRVTALCLMIAMIDGFDSTSLAFVVPTISREWHLAPGSFGLVFGMAFAGMLLGALAAGILADRFGRKPAIIGAMLTFGTLMLLTPLMRNLDELLLIRFLTGIGLGGALPNVTATTAEFLSHKYRSTGVAIMGTGIPIGSALAGLLTGYLLGPFGWHSVFIIGGGLAIVCCGIAAMFLPESPAYLRRKAARDQGTVVSPISGGNTGSVAALFRGRQALTTVVLWITLVLNYFDLHGLTAWTPTLFSQAGLNNATAASYGGMASVCGVGGMLVVGFLMDRLGASRVIGAVFLITGLALLAIVLDGSNVVLLALALFVATAGVDGANIGLFALSARLYETPIRSTGVGWAIGIGRAGSIVGPLVGGALLTVKIGGYSALFLTYAGTAFLGGISVMLLELAEAHKQRHRTQATRLDTPLRRSDAD